MQSTFLHRHSSCRKLVSLSLVAAMAGCANPIVRWNVPPAPTDKAVALPYAKLYASAAREAYRNEIATQFHTTNNLGAGLIGLGSLVAALAAGSAHKDAILGATLIGGTAYGIGQWNLRPQRLLIYQAGVEGINCALTAVIPLSMSEADIEQLRTGLTSIEMAMASTASALSRAKTAFGPAHMLGHATVEGDRVLCAIPTDVQLETALFDVRPRGNSLGWTAGPGLDEAGTLGCVVEVRDGATTEAFALSAMHVFSPGPRSGRHRCSKP